MVRQASRNELIIAGNSEFRFFRLISDLEKKHRELTFRGHYMILKLTTMIKG